MVRIHAIESLRFPGEGSSAQGKSGPKERPKGVSDGQQVEIPAPPISKDIVKNEVTNFQEAHWREKLVDIV